MLLQVLEVKPTKSGKGYMVTAGGGKKYYAALSTGIEQALGKQIEAELGSFQTATGVQETIQSFTTNYAQPAPTAFVGHSNGTDRWYMPFVSNICAHAIQSGLITSGEELWKWAAYAKHSALIAEDTHLPSGKPKESAADDDIPY